MSILCCFARPSQQSRESSAARPHTRETDIPGPRRNNDSYSYTYASNLNYISHPPPRYTPRPTSIHEKTLEAHLRDPSISSSDCPAIVEEKRRQELTSTHHHQDEFLQQRHSREDVTSDVSSALSFQSSYGNTSTATRETPPPPYSPRLSPSQSLCLSRDQSPAVSRRMSVSSAWSGTTPMAHVAQPRPVVRRGRESRSARSSLRAHEDEP